MIDLLSGVFVGCVLGIIAHEAGHAAVALITGLQLRAVIIGRGRTLFTRKYRGIRIRLNSVPLAGRVAVNPEFYQRKIPLLAFAFGGVIANVLLGLAVVFLWESGCVPNYLHKAVIGFYYMQAFLIIRNLIPQTLSIDGQIVHTDGKAILSLLKNPDRALSPAAQVYLLLLAQYTNGKDPLSALSPASPQLMPYVYLRHYGRIDRHDREDLSQIFSVELEKGELSVEEELLVLDGLVTDAVITGDPEARANIDGWSHRAISLGPNVRTLKFSRAAVLIELGQFAEGKALIEMSATSSDRPNDIILCNIFLARAEAGLGNYDRAEELITQTSRHMAANAREDKWAKENALLDRILKGIAFEKIERRVYQS